MLSYGIVLETGCKACWYWCKSFHFWGQDVSISLSIQVKSSLPVSSSEKQCTLEWLHWCMISHFCRCEVHADAPYQLVLGIGANAVEASSWHYTLIAVISYVGYWQKASEYWSPKGDSHGGLVHSISLSNTTNLCKAIARSDSKRSGICLAVEGSMQPST